MRDQIRLQVSEYIYKHINKLSGTDKQIWNEIEDITDEVIDHHGGDFNKWKENQDEIRSHSRI